MVGLLTGIISIVGAAWSVVDSVRGPAASGEIVAIVRDSAAKPVPTAVVEVLSPEHALVTTMVPGDDGVVRRPVVAGAYRVRVVHPHFVETEREVQVQPDAATEVNVVLARKPGTPTTTRAERAAREPRGRRSVAGEAADAVERGIGESRRLLGRLGL